jgi:hypothetical protein
VGSVPEGSETLQVLAVMSETSTAQQHTIKQKNKQTNKLRGFSPPVNYTNRATAACQQS